MTVIKLYSEIRIYQLSARTVFVYQCCAQVAYLHGVKHCVVTSTESDEEAFKVIRRYFRIMNLSRYIYQLCECIVSLVLNFGSVSRPPTLFTCTSNANTSWCCFSPEKCGRKKTHILISHVLTLLRDSGFFLTIPIQFSNRNELAFGCLHEITQK